MRLFSVEVHSRKLYWVELCPQSERYASGLGGATALGGIVGLSTEECAHMALLDATL